MDKLNLLHPSLGLAFTLTFNDPVLSNPIYVVKGDKAADGLPEGCDGCCEGLNGLLYCCQERDDG